MAGWIKLYRQIISSSKFADPDILRLWILCLTKASHKDSTVTMDKQEIKLLAGQFITGRFSLSEDYNAALSPRKKIKDTTLWSWLKRLEEWGDLDINSTNKYSVVSVVKWFEYQDTLTTELQQTDNKLTTKPQQIDTNKNVKKEKNVKKVKEETIYSDDFLTFWDSFPKQIGKPAAYANWNKLIKTIDPNYLQACSMNYASYCTANNTELQFIKQPNNFLNVKEEYYKQFETPVLIHSRSGQTKGKINTMQMIQDSYLKALEEEKREANRGY